MAFPKGAGWYVAGGFLLGTLGTKALTSNAAKRCYVQGVARGLQAKEAYKDVVEQARAQLDDIVAEANYINVKGSEAKPATAKAASAKTPAAKKATKTTKTTTAKKK